MSIVSARTLASRMAFLIFVFTGLLASAHVAAVPAVISPAPGTVIDQTSITISWESEPGASEYSLYVHNNDEPYGTNVHNGPVGSALSAQVSGITLNGGELDISIAAKVGGIWQQGAAFIHTYSKIKDPNVPGVRQTTRISNPAGASIPPEIITFDWNNSDSRVANYNFEVWSRPGRYRTRGLIYRSGTRTWSPSLPSSTTSQEVDLSTIADGTTLYVYLDTWYDNGFPTNDQRQYTVSSLVQADTIYEDGEDGSASAWQVYDNNPVGATVTNVFDLDLSSNVIELSGQKKKNGYWLGHKNVANARAWGNTTQKVISWDMKFAEPVSIYIATQTTAGFRYIYYSDSNIDRGIVGRDKNYIHHGIGRKLRDGEWHTVVRNLEADLQLFEPGNSIVSVSGFLIRGSGHIDNIKLVNDFPVISPATEVVYEDAENGDIAGWEVYDTTPSGAVVYNLFDNEKNSNVIGFSGSGRSNGYRFGHNNANSPAAWNNRTHTTISWDSHFSEPVSFFVATQTTKGFRFIYYSNSSQDRGVIGRNKNYIHIGLGDRVMNGSWETINRNLTTDLQKYEPQNKILSVNGLLIRGSGFVDNIKLSNGN